MHRFVALAALLFLAACPARRPPVVDLDARWLPSLVYYQGADFSVHRVATDPELLYELKPGIATALEGVETWGDPLRVVSTNAFGHRGPPREADKPDGVFRILALTKHLHSVLHSY